MQCNGWEFVQERFIADETRKMESEMSVGNGYMCLRAVDEEPYAQSIPFALVAGCFDKAPDQATELANFANVMSAPITVGGEALDLNNGTNEEYEKKLDLKTGLMSRHFVWTNTKGDKVAFDSRRFASMDDKHLFVTRFTLTALTDNVTVTARTGIFCDNRCGEPHFTTVDSSCDGTLVAHERTTESGIDFVIVAQCTAEGATLTAVKEGNDVLNTAEVTLAKGESLCIEKRVRIATTRDKEYADRTADTIAQSSLKALEDVSSLTFDDLHGRSAALWQKVWDEKQPVIDCEDPFDLFAVRFAIYHLTVMTPAHDDRMNIGAKGMTGPGYRGHAFWDTEIYMLPFFIFEDPAAARSLVTSRFRGLDGARRKAAENGYKGAMFPWESAWVTDGEVTPGWARTGLLEHHITADVAQGVQYYYAVTGDEEFMEKYGYELIFDTAVYWQSRVQWNEEKGRYEILCVIGPDEYREDVDNNAYTNYMAWYNMQLAIRYYNKLKGTPLFDRLNASLRLDGMEERWNEVCEKIYLPKPNEDGIVPQDDTILSLEHRDLTPYKQPGHDLFAETTEAERRTIQHSKQADVMVLFLLLEDLFTKDVKRKNFYYYEPVCLHGSSLSLSSYTMLSADIREDEMAYTLYRKACRIDLSDNIYASGDGVHAASLGGIWQGAVLGFLGVRLYGEQLRIEPHLPKPWRSVSSNIRWRGQKLNVFADHGKLTVRRVTGDKPVSFLSNGQTYTFDGEITVAYGD